MASPARIRVTPSRVTWGPRRPEKKWQTWLTLKTQTSVFNASRRFAHASHLYFVIFFWNNIQRHRFGSKNEQRTHAALPRLPWLAISLVWGIVIYRTFSSMNTQPS